MRPRKRLRDGKQYDKMDPNFADSDEGDVEIDAQTKQAIHSKMPPHQVGTKHLPLEKTDMPTETDEDKLIFTRVLGHFEMPHSHRWAETKHCWYCEHHVYTLVLASKQICSRFMVRPHGKDKKRLREKIIKNARAHRKEFRNNGAYNWGSDNDETYYDDEAEKNDFINKAHSKKRKQETPPVQAPVKKNEYYRNN